jgi:hypothetical protein
MEIDALRGRLVRSAHTAIPHRIQGLRTSAMKLFLRIFPLALMLLGAAVLFERPAYAYADPGTGLLAVQAAGSALVAAGWYLRRKIYALFHRGGSKGAGSDAPHPASSEDSPQP